MHLSLIPRFLAAAAAGAGLVLAASAGPAIPAHADAGSPGTDQATTFASDHDAGDPVDDAVQPVPATTPTAKPTKPAKPPRPQFTQPAKQPTQQPTQQAADQQPTDQQPVAKPAKPTKPARPQFTPRAQPTRAAESNDSATSNDQPPATTQTTVPQPPDDPASGSEPAATSTTETAGTTSTTTTQRGVTKSQTIAPEAGQAATASDDGQTVTAPEVGQAATAPEDGQLSAQAAECDPALAYLPLTASASTAAYPGDQAQITWSDPPAGATSVIITLTGDASWSTTVNLTANPAPTSAYTDALKNGNYQVTAVAVGMTDENDAAVCSLDEAVAAATPGSFTVAKIEAKVTVRTPVSWLDTSPIAITLSGFAPGSTVAVQVSDPSGNDISDYNSSCAIDPQQVDADGSFTIVARSFNGYDCFSDTGNFTVTATSTGHDGATASTTLVATDDPWDNPIKLTIDNNKLHVGDTTIIHGTGYEPGAVVTFYWSPNTGNQVPLGTATADADGNVTFTWTVGDDANGLPIDTGSGTVYGVDENNNYGELDTGVVVLTEDTTTPINVVVNPTPVKVLTSAPVDSRTFNTYNQTSNTYPRTLNSDNRTYNADNRTFNTDKRTSNADNRKFVTNNYAPKPPITPPNPAWGAAPAGGGQSLAATGADLSALGILIACLIGGGVVTLLARRRMTQE